MSRGSGARERAILDELRSGPLLEHELQWRVAQPADLEPDSTASDCGPELQPLRIKQTVFSAFRRALRNLEEGGKIVARSLGKVRDDSTLLRWFPFHTQSVALRDLRHRVLPYFLKFLDAHHPQFPSGQTEAHAFGLIDDDVKGHLWRRWMDSVVPELNRLMTHNPGHYLDCIGLSARGIQLFRPSPTLGTLVLSKTHWSIDVHQSLPRIAERLSGSAPAALMDFIRDAWAAANADHIAYKSRLYGGLNVTGHCELKTDAIHYMYMDPHLTPLFESFRDFPVHTGPGFLIRNDRNVGRFIHRLFSNRVFDEVKEFSLSVPAPQARP